MKTFIFSVFATAALFVSPAFANGGKAVAHINGLICDFCARSLEKTFGARDEVESITVNLDDKVAVVNFKDGQSIDDDTIKSLITGAGYEVVSIDRE